jgi:hypothetical protein
MKNFKNFTKAELISKLQSQKLDKNSNSSVFTNILTSILLFKSFLLKITLITLIIRIFKRFNLLRRLWIIINTVVMSIFGISMMDIYGLSILSALFAEIAQITGNIVNYLSNTKFYSIISGYLGYKIETPTRVESSSKIQPEIPRIEERVTRNSKISSWFEDKSQEIVENKPFYEDKYFIYGIIFVASCLTYYYFGDEIKLYTVSLWNLLRGRRPGEGNPPDGCNPENKINDDISTILMSSNLDWDLINEIKSDTNLHLMTSFRNIKSNVAIAAAITSYARIEMMQLKMLLVKLGINLYYTDTDSIFVDKDLPGYLIGNELGLLKDELKGGYIKMAYFLGIKKYGYIDDTNNIHSIFSGVARNSLTWDEIELISKGIIIVKPSPAKFFKNLSDLNINIKDSLTTSIVFNPRKKLLYNKYIPPKINIKLLITIDYYFRLLKNKIIHLINKYEIRKLKFNLPHSLNYLFIYILNKG